MSEPKLDRERCILLAESPFLDAPYRRVCPGNRIAMIAVRKERSLGENFAGAGPLQNDRAAVFMVPYQVNFTGQYYKERHDGLALVEQVFGRTWKPVPPAH